MMTTPSRAEAKRALKPGEWLMKREIWRPHSVVWATCTQEERMALDLTWKSVARKANTAVLGGVK
jgi:hypothetical protein